MSNPDSASDAARFKSLLDRDPANPLLRHRYAQALMATGDWQTALASLEMLIATRETTGVASDVALCLYHLGDSTRAIDVLEPRLRSTDHTPYSM